MTVHYATADGSAKAGSDYTAVSGTLSFAAGQTSKTVSVPISDDSNPEPNKSFTFTLSAPNGGSLGNATATLTIRNDDAAPRPPAPVVRHRRRAEGSGAGAGNAAQEQGKHVVLVQMLTGQSVVDTKGYAHYMLRCPVPAVKTVRRHGRPPGSRPAEEEERREEGPALQTVNVGSGKFTIKVGKSSAVR